MSTPLYHWSPTERRKGILRTGLVPGSWSTDRAWRPPHICFSETPSLAWVLSGDTLRGREIGSWDLWQTWSDRLSPGYEVIPMDDGSPREYRYFHRLYKRDLWYVATRTR